MSTNVTITPVYGVTIDEPCAMDDAEQAIKNHEFNVLAVSGLQILEVKPNKDQVEHIVANFDMYPLLEWCSFAFWPRDAIHQGNHNHYYTKTPFIYLLLFYSADVEASL